MIKINYDPFGIENYDDVVTNTVNTIEKNSGLIEWYKIRDCQYASCRVGIIEYKDKNNVVYSRHIFLKSYDTIVAGFVLGSNALWAYATGTFVTDNERPYSATTTRHINKFDKAITGGLFGYYFFKDLAMNTQFCEIEDERVRRRILDQIGGKFGLIKTAR